MKEKIEITQELCLHVKALLDGGLTQKQAAKFVKVSPATVSRISAAGFDVNKYNRDTYERRIMEKNRQADKEVQEIMKVIKQNGPLAVEKVEEKNGGVEITTRVPEEQVPGQISMDLHPAEEEKPEMSDQVKMMRFLAGKFKDTDDVIQITIGELILQVGKIYDMLGMIMRRMDK